MGNVYEWAKTKPCKICKRPVGHLRSCEKIAPFIMDAIQIVGLRGWPQKDMAIANVASLIERDGYPSWYRPIAERVE